MTDRLRALLAAATPGPWHAEAIGSEGYVVYAPPKVKGTRQPRVAACRYLDWGVDKANAALIVALLNAAPLMLDVIEAARAVIARVPHGMATETEVGLDLALAALDALEANHE